MATQADVMQLRIRFEYGPWGWTERYWIDEESYADALPIAEKICTYRRELQAVGVDQVYSAVHFASSEREKAVVLPNRVGPGHRMMAGYNAAATAAARNAYSPNDVRTCLVYRAETAVGDHADFTWRGVPDRWISRFKLDVPESAIMPSWWEAYPVGSPAIRPPSDIDVTLDAYLSSFLAYLRDNTVFVRKLSGDPPGSNFEVLPWSQIVGRRVSRRRTGRSLEPQRGRAR